LRVDLNSPAYQLDPCVQISTLSGQGPEQMKGLGVVRVGGEDLAIDLLRFVQSAGAMVLSGGIDVVLDIQIICRVA
jgi:hypothetical protein